MENFIPKLVRKIETIDFGNRKSFDEPKIQTCDDCGNNLFYIGENFGIIKDEHSFSATSKITNETEESKYYRKFSITVINDIIICGVCGDKTYGNTFFNHFDIVMVFQDYYDKEYYENCLEILQYPPETKKAYSKFRIGINELKKKIKEWEETQLKLKEGKI